MCIILALVFAFVFVELVFLIPGSSVCSIMFFLFVRRNKRRKTKGEDSLTCFRGLFLMLTCSNKTIGYSYENTCLNSVSNHAFHPNLLSLFFCNTRLLNIGLLF